MFQPHFYDTSQEYQLTGTHQSRPIAMSQKCQKLYSTMEQKTPDNAGAKFARENQKLRGSVEAIGA
jgi:hypothetical protein